MKEPQPKERTQPMESGGTGRLEELPTAGTHQVLPEGWAP